MYALCYEYRYNAVREKYPESEDETVKDKALRYLKMTRELLRQFNMPEKLTNKEVRLPSS